MEDPTFQTQEYMKHSAEFQRRLVSVRESRALLEKAHRMRKERASHMGFQFKQILWQMRRAQEDAYLAQERYMKLLQLGGHDLRYQEGNAKVAEEEGKCLHAHQVAQQNGYQVDQLTSHQNEHTKKSGSIQHEPKSAPIGLPEDLDVIQGTSFRFCTAIEENNDLTGRNTGDAQEIQSYLTLPNYTPEGRLIMNLPLQESSGELGKLSSPKLSDASERNYSGSTSVCLGSNLSPQEIILEQREKATNLRHGELVEEHQSSFLEHDEKEGPHTGQRISLGQENACDGSNIMNSQLDLPLSIMPTSLPVTTSSLRNAVPDEAEEVEARAVEKKSSEDGRKVIFKIQRSDFLSQRISKELEDFTKNSSSAVCVSQPTASEDAALKKGAGPFEAESTLKKNAKMTRGQAQEARLTIEEMRKIMEAWYPQEKIAVLATITNTMFLWDIDPSSSQEQHYGSWPACEPMFSAALAARGSQEELFNFLDTVKETLSRPMICCGAVCELLKVYPPGKLLPIRFIEDFFASDPKESEAQCRSQRVIEGLTFDHLEVYQEEEHIKFWQMLVHHAVSVKDHKLASLRQIARVFVEILFPSSWTENFTAERIRDLHQDLVEFITSGFKAKTTQLVHVHYEDEDCAAGKKLPNSFEKMGEEDHGSEIQSQTQQSGICGKGSKGFAKGHRSGRSSQLRPVSSKKGPLSCFGLVVRTKFRIWRLKALSRGVDTVDDAVVCLLRNKPQEPPHPRCMSVEK